MSSDPLLAAEPPSQYDFHNWDQFYRDAMQYHAATRPGDERVSDRIETFRKFMSGDVVQHLGGFVRPHPRFRTVEGWDQWVTNVTESLRPYDATIGRSPTVAGCIASFRAGKASERKFWDGLDMLASRGDITSEQQRQYFWDAHSWQSQQRLAERCPYFDPRHAVWTAGEAGAAEDAERKLSQIMEFSVVDEQVVRSRRVAWLTGSGLGLMAIPTAVSFVVMDVADKSYNDGMAIAAFLFGILSASVMAVLLVLLVATLVQQRRLLQTQRDVRSVEPV